MSSTSDVLAHHLESFGAGDIDATLADYASDAVMFTPDGPLMGPDAIRPVFAAMLAEFGQPGMSFEMTTQSVEGPTTCTRWERTRSSCGAARSWRSPLPPRPRPIAERMQAPATSEAP